MEPTQAIVPLTDQVVAARIAYLAACDAAAAITREHGELRLSVGGNETERRAAAKRTTPEEYDAWLVQYAALDAARSDAIAWRDRCEKDLNTLRDLLNRETAELERGTVERCEAMAQLAHTTAARQADTADVWARIAGASTSLAEIRARFPEAVLGGMCPDCKQSMLLDVHGSCTPF